VWGKRRRESSWRIQASAKLNVELLVPYRYCIIEASKPSSVLRHRCYCARFVVEVRMQEDWLGIVLKSRVPRYLGR
jgi:hypothetical protein